MTESYRVILDNLRSYSGTGFLFILLLAAITFLSIRHRKSDKKYMLVWYPVVVLLIYFCPVWIVYVAKRNDADILYRLLWLIPSGVIICVALIELIYMLPSKNRALGVVASVILIILSGKYTYANTQFTKAENVYHMPQTVVDICDDLKMPGREVRACFPDELLQYVRQYSSYVHMPYGRDIFYSGFMRPDVPLWDILHEEEIDVQALVDELRRTDTHYLIIDHETELSPALSEYDFVCVNTVDGYDVYVDARNAVGEYRLSRDEKGNEE